MAVEGVRLLANLGDEGSLEEGREVLGVGDLGTGEELIVDDLFNRTAHHLGGVVLCAWPCRQEKRYSVGVAGCGLGFFSGRVGGLEYTML